MTKTVYKLKRIIPPVLPYGPFRHKGCGGECEVKNLNNILHPMPGVKTFTIHVQCEKCRREFFIKDDETPTNFYSVETKTVNSWELEKVDKIFTDTDGKNAFLNTRPMTTDEAIKYHFPDWEVVDKYDSIFGW